jgi:hypothetical protein
MLAIVDGTMHKDEFETRQEFDSVAARHFTSWGAKLCPFESFKDRFAVRP